MKGLGKGTETMPVFLKRWKIHKVSYENSLFFFFLAGTAAGTLAAYWFRAQLPEVLAGLEKESWFGGAGTGDGLVMAVAGQRLLEAVFGWLVGMTSFSAMAFWGIAAYAGMASSLILCLFTVKKGMTGIVCYFFSIMPHGLLYGMVWGILAFWAGKKPARPRIFSFFLVLLLTAAGGFLEAAVSPGLLKLVLH